MNVSDFVRYRVPSVLHTGFRPPLRLGCSVCSWSGGPASASGVDSIESTEASLMSSFLSIDIFSSIAMSGRIQRLTGSLLCATAIRQDFVRRRVEDKAA